MKKEFPNGLSIKEAHELIDWSPMRYPIPDTPAYMWKGKEVVNIEPVGDGMNYRIGMLKIANGGVTLEAEVVSGDSMLSKKRAPAPSPVPMPVHDTIEANGDHEQIQAISNFLEVLRETHLVKKRESGDVLTSDHQFLRLIFDYLGYDYDAWVEEKEALRQSLYNPPE